MKMRDDDDVTPTRAIFEFWAWLPAWVLYAGGFTVFIFIVVFAGWKAGFWFDTHNAENQAKVAKINTQTIQNGISFQEAQITTLQDRIADVASTTVSMIGTSGVMYTDLSVERIADGNAACKAASLITTIPAADQAWVSQNCSAGSLSPTSPFYK